MLAGRRWVLKMKRHGAWSFIATENGKGGCQNSQSGTKEDGEGRGSKYSMLVRCYVNEKAYASKTPTAKTQAKRKASNDAAVEAEKKVKRLKNASIQAKEEGDEAKIKEATVLLAAARYSKIVILINVQSFVAWIRLLQI